MDHYGQITLFKGELLLTSVETDIMGYIPLMRLTPPTTGKDPAALQAMNF